MRKTPFVSLPFKLQRYIITSVIVKFCHDEKEKVWIQENFCAVSWYMRNFCLACPSRGGYRSMFLEPERSVLVYIRRLSRWLLSTSYHSCRCRHDIIASNRERSMRAYMWVVATFKVCPHVFCASFHRQQEGRNNMVMSFWFWLSNDGSNR